MIHSILKSSYTEMFSKIKRFFNKKFKKLFKKLMKFQKFKKILMRSTLKLMYNKFISTKN